VRFASRDAAWGRRAGAAAARGDVGLGEGEADARGDEGLGETARDVGEARGEPEPPEEGLEGVTRGEMERFADRVGRTGLGDAGRTPGPSELAAAEAGGDEGGVSDIDACEADSRNHDRHSSRCSIESASNSTSFKIPSVGVIVIG
jgi:hypothetical protein